MTRKRLVTLVAFFIFGCCVPPIVGLLVSCTPEMKTAADYAIRIGDDVCEEVENAATTPEWATLLCTVVDAVDNRPKKFRVLLPKQEWRAIKARRPNSDAGKSGDAS